MFVRPCLLIISLVILEVRTQDVPTPASLLGPRNYNHHPFNAKQFLRELRIPETTKQGPVLFPNDGPPPPRNPLIVTSRPLLESVARSELGVNNTIPQSTQLNNVIQPFLARVKEYRPYQYNVADSRIGFTPAPYVNVKGDLNRFDDYEDQTPLPPIYKAFSDHAKQNVLKLQQQKNNNHYDYQTNEPDYINQYKNSRHSQIDQGSEDYDQNQNYAFSYRVKDQKTGDDFSHSQHSSGSATNGEYRVRLPDGRMQIVSYKADENGYHADVRYDDEDKTSGNSIDSKNDNHDNFNAKHIQYNDNRNHYNDKHHNFNNNNDYHYNDKHHNFNNNNDYHYNDYKRNQYNENHDNAEEREYKTENDKYKAPVSNDYYNQYADSSKEYYNDDLSSEYESKNYDYAPHKSKFTSFLNNKKYVTPKSNFVASSTVKPSYEELKDLLVTKNAYNTVQPSFFTRIPVEINVPSTTPSTFEENTERVVLIGGKKPNLYTSITSSRPFVSSAPISVTPVPVKYSSDFVSSTPRNYLVSTIATLRNNVDFSGPKPVLSNNFIDRINKYLSFN